MKHFNKLGVKLIAMLAIIGAFSLSANAQLIGAPDTKRVRPPGLENVAIDQRLNEQVPLDLTFTDEQGKAVRLGDYFREGRPVVLNLVYYQCPMLCGEVLTGLSAALKVLKFSPGKEFEVVTVSINPRETPDLAAKKKETFVKRVGRPEAAAGWHFLVGQQKEIDALAEAVGFHYQYDPKTDQYAHAAGIMLLTPRGRIAQYYYGVEYSAKDMRLGIIEASHNKIGTLADAVLLYCYHYDPRTGKYGPVVMNIIRLAGVMTVVVISGFLVVMFRRENQTRAKATAGDDKGQGRA